MNDLHDRIGTVNNTQASKRTLEQGGVELSEFQCIWHKESSGRFEMLPELCQEAITAGEQELTGVGELIFA